MSATAGAIVYLDIDDEITSAATRVRQSDARRVALVLPYGSRVATSRINFRLLSRDALINEKQLAAISGDPATRALAASAGLPVFASVAEYESSFAGTDAAVGPAMDPMAIPDAAASARPFAAGGALPVPPADTAGSNRAPATEARAPGQRRASNGPPASSSTSVPARRAASRSALVVGLAVLAMVLLAGGVAAFLLLPSATIVIQPRPEPLTPVEITVRADPGVTAPNASTLVVPATQVPLDLSVSDTFATTGKRVDETAATGRVRFSNLDFLRTNSVAGGSIVSTNAGVRFRTNSTVTVPRADLVGLTVFPGTITVGVTAVDPGLAGNVEPNTIVIVPRGEDPQALKVVNPDALTGGTHEEIPLIEQADIDAALKQLGTELDAELQSRLADPSIAPPGATLFRETATIGASTPTVDPASLLGKEIDAFDLGLTATGSVIAVDPSPISSMAEQKLRATVTADHQLVAGSIEVTVGTASVAGQTVTFPATASARQVATLDPNALRVMVLGKSLDDARAILAPYGDVEVTAWPDWMSSVPTMESRVLVSIEGAVPVETPAPSGSPS